MKLIKELSEMSKTKFPSGMELGRQVAAILKSAGLLKTPKRGQFGTRDLESLKYGPPSDDIEVRVSGTQRVVQRILMCK